MLCWPSIAYIQISTDAIVVRDYATRESVKTLPFIETAEHNGKTIVKSIGNGMRAKEKPAAMIYPFFGDAGYVNDALRAAAIINHCLYELRQKLPLHRRYRRFKHVIIHFVDSESRVANIENKVDVEVFKDLLSDVETHRVYLKYGPVDYSFEALVQAVYSTHWAGRLAQRFLRFHG